MNLKTLACVVLLTSACSDNLPPLGDADGFMARLDGNQPTDGPTQSTGDGPTTPGDLAPNDPGPTFNFTKPTGPTVHNTIPLDFTVTDTVNAVDPNSVKVGILSFMDTKEVTIALVPGSMPLHYTGTIDLTKYTPPLVGTVLVRAQAASMSGAVGNGSVQVTVDNNGPDIVFETPAPGAFVGGVVQLKISVSDPSGVNDGTVKVIFGNPNMPGTMVIPLQRAVPSMPDFVAVFDFHVLGKSYVSPQMSAYAEDTYGNSSLVAEEIIVDNSTPEANLDPPNVRVNELVSGVYQCSREFDPVGADSADDAFAYPQIITLRARLEDRGNTAPGLRVERWSGVDASTVELLVLPTTSSSGQLLVDTDNDGICDEANPLLQPVTMLSGTNEVLALAMAQLQSAGTPDYRSDPSNPAPIPGVCDVYGSVTATTAPNALCAATVPSYTYAPRYGLDTPESVVWSLPPVGTAQTSCVGLQFDSNNVPEGPACVAVRAVDNAGNVGISPPLRVCVCHGDAGSCAACSAWPKQGSAPFATPPDCTGVYDKMTNTVAAGSKCTPPVSDFVDHEFQGGVMPQL